MKELTGFIFSRSTLDRAWMFHWNSLPKQMLYLIPRFRVILIGRWLDCTDKLCSWGVKSNHKHVLKIPRKLPSIKLPPEKLPPRQTVPLRLSHFFQSEHTETYKYTRTHQQSDTYIHESALWEISTSGTLQREPMRDKSSWVNFFKTFF